MVALSGKAAPHAIAVMNTFCPALVGGAYIAVSFVRSQESGTTRNRCRMVDDLSEYDSEVVNHPALEPGERDALVAALRASRTSGSGLGCLIPILVLLGLIGWGALEVSLYASEHGYTVGRLMRAGIMIMVAPLLLILRSWIRGDGAGHSMKKDWRRPILYLRNSHIDGPPNIDRIGPLEPNPVQIGAAVEVSVNSLFEPWGPVVGIEGFISDWMGPRRVPRTPEWQNLVSAFMKISYAAVFVPGKLSEPIKYELHRASELMPPRRVLFYVGPAASVDQEYQKLVQQLFPNVGIGLSRHSGIVAGDGSCVPPTIGDLERILGRTLR